MRQFLLFAPFLAANLFAQQQLAPPADAVTENIPPATAKASEHAHETKRIFWIVPNFRTAPTLAQYQPLETKEKFHIATEDSLDHRPCRHFRWTRNAHQLQPFVRTRRSRICALSRYLIRRLLC